VFSLLVAGRSITEIANSLHLSVKTVSTHKTRIMQKMGMSSLSEMVQYAVAHRCCRLSRPDFAFFLVGKLLQDGVLLRPDSAVADISSLPVLAY
jgi:hypothetical protein